jgi:hypothetical protein
MRFYKKTPNIAPKFFKIMSLKSTLITLFLFHTIFAFSQKELPKIERILYDLPDISFEKLNIENSPYPEYKLKIKQPLDHKNPEKGHFYQQVRITHHGFDRPTVMSTQGYQIFLGKSEIEAMLDANHLNIEHRFFGESVPDSLQWQYLTSRFAPYQYAFSECLSQ